jgi:hypothetical protein
MGSARLRATGVALLAAALAAIVLSAGASAAPSKPYSVVICGDGQSGCTSANPAVIAPGGTTSTPSTLSVTFTNDNKLGSGIQLGSDNLNVPSTATGFSVTGVTATLADGMPMSNCPASFNNSARACFILMNQLSTGGFTTIAFRNLNLPPGQSSPVISISAITPGLSTTPCPTTSPCLWTDEAKQSNDFSGTGNDLNSDSNSAKGTVMSAVASCPQKKGCSTVLANGGTTPCPPPGQPPTPGCSAPGSITTTISTSSGKTAVTQIESIDLGGPQTLNCSGLSSPHLTSLNLSGGGNNGSDRSQTITITTTHFPDYVAEGCFETAVPFTEKVVVSGVVSLKQTTQTMLPDGTIVFQGLLPDCGTQTNQVNCNKTPGVVSRQTTFATDGPPPTPLTHTLVVQVPPGFDSRIGN